MHPTWKAYQQDVTTFEAEENYYDIIILIGGLHHVPDYAENVCANLGRALKRGGLFINFEPTNNNPLIKCIREVIYKKNHLFDAETESAFSLKKYNQMFKDAGLIVEKQFFPGLLGYVMYYNPDAFTALNRGTTQTVDKVFGFEYKNYTRFLGKLVSFTTFSVFRKV